MVEVVVEQMRRRAIDPLAGFARFPYRADEPRGEAIEPSAAKDGASVPMQLSRAGGCTCSQCSRDKAREDEERRLREAGIQRAAAPDGGPMRVDAGSIQARLTGGAPLPAPVAERFSRSYGRDLSNVRVHANSPLAPQVGARAFTVGRDVAFAPGEYKPGTPAGDRLIGHELAHVVQQAGGAGAVQGAGLGEDGYEREADRAAEVALSGGRTLGLSPTMTGRPQLEKGSPATPPAPEPPAPDATTSPMDDEVLARQLDAVPGIDGSGLIATLGGLGAMARTHPETYERVRQRTSSKYGDTAFQGVLANDARVLVLVQRSQDLDTRIEQLVAGISDGKHEAELEMINRLRGGVDSYTYGEAMGAYAKSGAASIDFWEMVLGASPDVVLHDIATLAQKAQDEADAREEENARYRVLGLTGLGRVVASREGLVSSDIVMTTSILAPLEGAAHFDDALARARLAGVAAAVVEVQGRYYVYGLSADLSYSELWSSAWAKEGGRSRLDSVGDGAAAVLSREGYVLRRRSKDSMPESFYSGGDQASRPDEFLAADERLLENEADKLSNEEALRLFRQLALNRVFVNLSAAEARLRQQLGRLFEGPGGTGMPTREAGAKLKGNTSELRRHMLDAQTLIQKSGNAALTEPENERLRRILEKVGELTKEEPTAALMVENKRGAGDKSKVESDDVKDRLAGQDPAKAALTAAQELKHRLDNVRLIRSHLQADPDRVLSIPEVCTPVLFRFSGTQRLYLEATVRLRPIADLAAALGMAAAELVVAVTAGAIGGWPAIIVGAAGVPWGGYQLVKQYEDLSRLKAMSELDVAGGVQLATPEQVKSANRWALAMLGLAVVLHAGGAALSARHMRRVRGVLEDPALGRVLAETELNLEEAASRLGMSERALLRKLETASGAERAALLERLSTGDVWSKARKLTPDAYREQFLKAAPGVKAELGHLTAQEFRAAFGDGPYTWALYQLGQRRGFGALAKSDPGRARLLLEAVEQIHYTPTMRFVNPTKGLAGAADAVAPILPRPRPALQNPGTHPAAGSYEVIDRAAGAPHDLASLHIRPGKALDHNGAFHQRGVAPDVPVERPQGVMVEAKQLKLEAGGAEFKSLDKVAVFGGHGSRTSISGMKPEEIARILADELQASAHGANIEYVVLDACHQGEKRFIVFGETNAQAVQKGLDVQRLVRGQPRVIVMAARQGGPIYHGAFPGTTYRELLPHRDINTGKLTRHRSTLYVPAEEQPGQIYLSNAHVATLVLLGVLSVEVAGLLLRSKHDKEQGHAPDRAPPDAGP